MMSTPICRIAYCLSGLLLCLSLMQACSQGSPADVAHAQPISALERHAQAWADSTLASMSPSQKAAQLILVAAPTDLDSIGRSAFADSLTRRGFGGLLLDAGQRDSMRLLCEACHGRAGVPTWGALDAGTAWSQAQGWPSLLSLGTVASDSLAQSWGQALAAECHYLGAQICMVSAGKVAAKGSWTQDALSASPTVVARMSDALLRGITDAHVQACIRPLREAQDAPALDSLGKPVIFHEGLPELHMGAAMPFQRLLKAHSGVWLQATTAAYTAVDTLPIARSPRALGYFLREKLHFPGLVLSPRGGNVEHLRAGADLLVAPQDPVAMVSAILAAVQNGSLRQTWLDSTVHKLLVSKAMLDLDKNAGQALTSIDPYRSLLRLDRAIGKATMVVLRDEKGRLPLGAGIPDKRIATLAYGLAHLSEMQVSMQAYASMDHFILSAKTDTAALRRQVERLREYDYVVVSLHDDLVQDSANGRLAQRSIDFLKKLDGKTRLVVVDFAGRNSLEDLKELSCLAFVSEDRERSANLAGQAIMGAFPVTALLPDDVSPSFTAGMGKILPRKLRLEYTDPSDLGVRPEAMERIDSLLEDAIKKEVFPGCQVFAAIDGKVFLHKAYGYHDYERRQRVRNDDLYDIASVSKIAATTLMAMGAFERDTLRLDQPLKYFMPDLDSAFITIKDITPQQLMTHTAGLPPGIILNRFFRMVAAHDSIRSKIYSTAIDSIHTVRIAEDLYLAPSYRDSVWDRVRRIHVVAPGTYEYSDLSMYLMKALLERILGEPIEQFVRTQYYQPMGLRRICYRPLDRFEKEEIVPTAQDKHWRKQVLQGDVHDPTVAFLGGIGGPAGIFSNSKDLATIMQMLLNGGAYGGEQFFDPKTVELFTSRQPGCNRGLGFDKQLRVPSCEKGYCCYSAAPETFGHFGFTGTCAWADPQNKLVYVFLSNRVYPDDTNKKINVYRVRQAVQQLIYDALGLGMVPVEECDNEDA